ncbi:MAG: hypothetical protein ACFFCW_26270 [Candidatus Hodarchaeota archaeon]
MSDNNREELERIKLQREIAKIETEIRSLHTARVRAWVTALSVAVGIIVSAIGLYQTLKEIRHKDRQLAMEAQIRSHEIFLNQVLDRISGIKTEYWELRKVGKDEKLVNVKDERYGGTTMVGAYAAAVSLAKEFPALRGPAKEALERQGGDRARKFLQLLEKSSPATPK